MNCFNSIALRKRNTVVNRAAWEVGIGLALTIVIAEYKYTLKDKLNSVLPPSESLVCHDVGLVCYNKKHIAVRVVSAE